jgi:hypothetical protein
MGRNKRGNRGTSMRARLAVAAAVLVGGGAAGVAVVASHHGSGTQEAASAGYSQSLSNRSFSESEGLSIAMNDWSKSSQTSLVVISKIVTIKTIAVVAFHSHTLDVQRGVVEAADKNQFVIKSSNDAFQIWNTKPGGTQELNVGGSQTGWNALSGGTMSSYGSYNWSNISNSKWNTSAKTLAKGDVVWIFGEKVKGQLWAQLVLFAAPGSSHTSSAVPSSNNPGGSSWSSSSTAPRPSSTMPTFAGSNS